MYCRYLHVIQVLIKLTKNKEKTIAITLPQRKSYNIIIYVSEQNYKPRLYFKINNAIKMKSDTKHLHKCVNKN